MVTNDVPLVVRVSLHTSRASGVRPKGRSAEQGDQSSARVAVTLSILPGRVFYANQSSQPNMSSSDQRC